MVIFLWKKKIRKQLHIQASSTSAVKCGKICLLLLCSWCRDPHEASGRWSMRETGERVETVQTSCCMCGTKSEVNWINRSYCQQVTKGMEGLSELGVVWEGNQNHSLKVDVTLFIFSRMQGFPSEYPKLLSDRPEQRLKMPLLKRQASFVMPSVSSCRKYSPWGHSLLFSCSVSLYPERQRWKYIQINGINHWKSTREKESGICFNVNLSSHRVEVPLLRKKASRCWTYCEYLSGSDLLNMMSSEFGRITNPATKTKNAK